MNKSRTGSNNLITDVKNIFVGTAEDESLSTGVTLIIGDKPFLAAVDVRGGGPGTKEIDLLHLENSIGRIDAIVLSGGSAFGLDASSEIQKLLKEDKKGYLVGDNVIPLVPSAVIFDLISSNNYWKNGDSIWRLLAKKAYTSIKKSFPLGSVGAGYGATTSTLKGGQGSASWRQKFSDNKYYTVGAIVINNSVGNPLINDGPHFLSGHLEINNEFGGIGSSSKSFDGQVRAKRISNSYSNEFNTVIGVVATDAPLSRSDLKRLAIMSHDGIARSIHPSHTPMDGDTIFAITNKIDSTQIKSQFQKSDLSILGSLAADCVSRSCNRAVYEAKSITNINLRSWKDKFKN